MRHTLLRELIKEILSTPKVNIGQITKDQDNQVTLHSPLVLNFDPNNKDYIKDIGNQTFKIHRDSETSIPIIFAWQLPGAISYKDHNGDFHTLPKKVIFNNKKLSSSGLAPLKALKDQGKMPHLIIPQGMKQMIIDHTAKQAALRLKSRIKDKIDVILTPQSSSPLVIDFADKLSKELGVPHVINDAVVKDFSAADFVIPPNKIAIAKKQIRLTKNNTIEKGEEIPFSLNNNGEFTLTFNVGDAQYTKKLNIDDFDIIEEPGGTDKTIDLVSQFKEKLLALQAAGKAGKGAAAQIHNQFPKSIRRYAYNWMKLSDHAKVELKKYIKQTNAIIVDDSHGEKATIIETAQEIYYSNPKINIVAAVTMFDEK